MHVSFRKLLNKNGQEHLLDHNKNKELTFGILRDSVYKKNATRLSVYKQLINICLGERFLLWLTWLLQKRLNEGIFKNYKLNLM